MTKADFKVNDKVVHPQYGGGYVSGIESIEVGGEAIECLKIRCVSKGRKIFVPKGSIALCAIRPPLSDRRFRELRKTLTGEPEALSRNFNRRMKQVKTKLDSGDPMQVGEVVRDLYPKWSENSLSSSDERIFEKCRDLLVSEFALIKDYNWDEAAEYFEKTLANGHGSKSRKNPR
ncbi:MAG TPA: CarD family transcriptional regulator [Gemmatimonadota bacterium]|nr:CarD family transcriptional regulator [Gemmatimonadota bacterium]